MWDTTWFMTCYSIAKYVLVVFAVQINDLELHITVSMYTFGDKIDSLVSLMETWCNCSGAVFPPGELTHCASMRLNAHLVTVTWPVTRCVILRVAHAPGMPGTFSPPPRFSDPDMPHGTCVTYVQWCMSGSLTSGFLWRRWRGKLSRRMRNPQFCVSGKRPMAVQGDHEPV